MTIDTGGASRSHDVRRHWRLAGAVAAVGLLGIALFTFGSGDQDAPEAAAVSPAETAVRGFFAALGSGEVDDAMAWLDADHSLLVLPGLSNVVTSGDRVRDRLGFLSVVAGIEVGRCTAVRTSMLTEARSSARCTIVVDSDYRSALGLAEAAGTVTAVAEGDRLRSIAAIDDRLGGFIDYCVWALDADAEGVDALFDDRCLPVETAATAAEHLALAAAYAERGHEAADPIRIVEAFVRIHNTGASPIGMFGSTYRVATFPGVPIESPHWPFPDLADYLEWSGVVYDFDIGACVASERSGAGLVAVDCASARLGGPLPQRLGLDPVPTPIRFFVEDGRIAGVSGRSPQALIDAFASQCTTLRGASVLGAGCTPLYDAASAEALLAAIG